MPLREARWRPALVNAVLDGDPQALAIARAKPGADRIEWREGTAGALPLEDASVDRVVVSLVLHHLSDPAKSAALAEMRRVLRPGGRLHVADWGRPRGPVPTVGFRVLQAVDGVENTRALGAGRLPELLGAAGFADVRLVGRLGTAFGTLELLVAA
jgi:SAM-dependent methyltransferase